MLGLAAFTALGLAAAPAHAQSLILNSGDNAVVSGAGTVGTVGGTPVTNTTSTYTDAGNRYAVETNGTATFTLADGGTLSSAHDYDDGLGALGSGAVIISGGSISGGDSGDGLYASGSSPVTVSGGSISAGEVGTGLYVNGSGAVTISGGTIAGGSGGTGLYFAGNAVTISGGTITGGSISAGQNGNGLYANEGVVTISGGTFIGGSSSAGYGGVGLGASFSALVTITGGTFSAGQGGTGVGTSDGGAVTISGGTFSAGPGGAGLVDQGGTINLFSAGDSAFLIDGVAMNNTTLDSSLYTSGNDTISGTLENGDVLDTTFAELAYTGSKINLNIGTPPAAVPEASTTVSFGLLLILGLGGVVLARKKRAIA